MGSRQSFNRCNWLGLLAGAGLAVGDDPRAGSVRSRLPKGVPAGVAAIIARRRRADARSV